MTTAYLALRWIVKNPLHFRERWGEMLGKFEVSKWITAACAMLTLALIGGQLMFGAGGWMSGQSKDIQALQSQYREMTIQMTTLREQVAPLAQVPALIQRLNDRLDAVPRADLMEARLSEIQRHLSALDGRSDATETRLRADEERAVRDATRLDQIDSASKATLGNHR